MEVCAGDGFTIDLRADGTVVGAGWLPPEIHGWRDIVSVSGNYEDVTGCKGVIGLKADGTVLTAPKDVSDNCFTGDWRGIVAVSSGYKHFVGLKTDGSVVVCGDTEKTSIREDTAGWQGIGQPDRNLALQVIDWASKGLCRYCGGKVDLLNSKCKACGKKN